MQNFCPSQTDMVWYNVRVPHMRDALIFDIGPVTRDERRLEVSLPSHRPEATGGPATAATQGNGQTQQRIGSRGEASNFSKRKTEYDGASRGYTRGVPSFLVFR